MAHAVLLYGGHCPMSSPAYCCRPPYLLLLGHWGLRFKYDVARVLLQMYVQEVHLLPHINLEVVGCWWLLLLHLVQVSFGLVGC